MEKYKGFESEMLVINTAKNKLESIKEIYRKVASSNTSCLEAHAGFFRLLMKRIFDSYAL